MKKIKLTEKDKVYGKKYNNKSSLVQQWTTQKLKSTYISCMSAVNSDCFASHDITVALSCQDELEARGYTIHSGTPTITKE